MKAIFLAFVCLALPCGTSLGQSVQVEVEIKSVDAKARTITVEFGGKATDLDISRKAKIFVSGNETDASSLVPGDKATVEYNKELEVVTKIEAEGKLNDGWRFFDTFAKGVSKERAVVIASDGRAICNTGVGLFCLASINQYSDCTFKVDFQFRSNSFKGDPFISIASTLPNPTASDWTKQIPFGVEIKLHPERAGEIVLPSKDFKIDLPLGQLRDERKVVRLRNADMKANEWNNLEVTVDVHKNITVKINGTTVNALAKAENTKGHIILAPQSTEVHFRNPSTVLGGEEKSLTFESITAK